MVDAPHPGGGKPNCPGCGSARVETTDPTTTLLDYRCRDCGTEFDEDGGVAVEE